jgi:hypothetical protein
MLAIVFLALATICRIARDAPAACPIAHVPDCRRCSAGIAMPVPMKTGLSVVESVEVDEMAGFCAALATG